MEFLVFPTFHVLSSSLVENLAVEAIHRTYVAACGVIQFPV